MEGIFSYEFMRIALVAVLSISVMLAFVGKTVVLKNISLVGDVLSHTSLLGVAAGLIIGLNPIVGAVIVCIIATMLIEVVRKKFGRYADLSLALILSFGLAASLIISKYYKGTQSFESYLFGALTLLTWNDIAWVIPICSIVSVICIVFYKEFYLISMDETMAKMSGVKTKFFNGLFILVLAVSVGISVRAAGALLVSALMTIPIANSFIITKSYKKITIVSIFFALEYAILGWLLSFYMSKVPMSAMLVVVGTISCLLTLFIKKIFKK